MSQPFKAVQWIVWGGIGATLIGIAGAFVISRSKPALDRQPSIAPRPEVLFEVGDFTLTNQFGKSFGLADLKGKVWVADIVFTSCAVDLPLHIRDRTRPEPIGGMSRC